MPQLTDDQIESFHRDGYVVVPRLFDGEEIELLGRAARQDRQLDQHAFGRADGEGGTVRLSVWNRPGDNIYGMFARCRRIVDGMESLLGGEVYHYHSKMILKDPQVGGAWAWHQDYGYWYHNGALLPLMASVSIAVDEATRKNGCMQLLKGSHRMGRIDHVLVGTQTGADAERVEQARARFELVHCQLEPGDALFFHCNVLHRSDQNRSEAPRWSLICCYNAARNDPYKDSHHPRYEKLDKVEDGAIKEVGLKRFDGGNEVAWMDPDRALAARRRELAGEEE